MYDRTYFSLVTRGHTGSQDTVLDAARGQVIKDSVVWIVEYTAIIFHGSGAIEN